MNSDGAFTFRSISTNGAANGIIWNNASLATGSFTVTGTSTTAGTGGTIQSSTAKGADFRSSNNVTLKNMNFTSNATANNGTAATCGDALNGTNGPSNCNANISLLSAKTTVLNGLSVTGSKQIGIDVHDGSDLTLTNLTVTGNGNEVGEDGVQIVHLLGTLAVSGGIYKDNAANQFEVQNGISGTLTINVDNATFSNTSFPTGATTPSNTTANSGLFVATHGASATTIINPTVTNTTFDRIFAKAFRADMAGATTMTVRFGPASGAGNVNNVTNSGQGVSITGSNTGGITYSIRNSNFQVSPAVTAGGATNQIGVSKSALGGTWTGVISNNVVGTAGTTNSGCEVAGCEGISIGNNNSSGPHKLSIISNQIHQTEGSAIGVLSGGGSDSSSVALAIQSNTIGNPDQNAGAANPAILIQSGSSIGTDVTNTCADISSNAIAGTWSLGTSHQSSIRVRSLTTASGSFSLLNFNPATDYPDSAGAPAGTTGGVGTVGDVADFLRSVNPAVSNAPPGQNAASATQGSAVFSNSGSCPVS